MIEFLRALKLGAVNLFGIAIPGFLILLLSLSGVVAPSVAVGLGLTHTRDLPGQVWQENRLLIIAVFLVLSYVAGYILRLTSPDDLDEISAKKVLGLLRAEGAGEDRWWPYTGEPGDRFPYFNFGCYLDRRGLKNLRRHATWAGDSQVATAPDEFTKRSKTAIHLMKLDIMMSCPDLYAVIESNEAHVRLMSGTWIAVRATHWIVFTGIILGVAGISLFSALGPPEPFDPKPWLLVLAIMNASFFAAMAWAKKRIENLFHYRRVNELVWIVMAANVAREKMVEDGAVRLH